MAKKAQKMVMKEDDVRRRLRLLKMWDWHCVLCGDRFESLHSVTIEHLVPKSVAVGLHDNLAPSHYNCNQFRCDMSLLDAVYVLSRKRRVMGPRAFREWTNKKVPNRTIPQEFLAISMLPPRERTGHQLPLPGFELFRVSGD